MEIGPVRVKPKAFPSFAKEGWLRRQKNAAEPPLKAQTGWSGWSDHARCKEGNAFGSTDLKHEP